MIISGRMLLDPVDATLMNSVNKLTTIAIGLTEYLVRYIPTRLKLSKLK